MTIKKHGKINDQLMSDAGVKNHKTTKRFFKNMEELRKFFGVKK